MEYLHHCVAPQCSAIPAGGGVLTCAKLRGVEPMNHNFLHYAKVIPLSTWELLSTKLHISLL